MSDEQKQRYRETRDKCGKYTEYQKNYRKNMGDEQKQRYREARNKCDKYKYCNMTDEQKQKI